MPWPCYSLTRDVLLSIEQYCHEPLRPGRFGTVFLRDTQWNHTVGSSSNTLVETWLTVRPRGYELLIESYFGCSATSIPFTHAIPLMGTKLRMILPCALGRMPKKVRSRGRPSPPASLYMSKFLSRATPLQ